MAWMIFYFTIWMKRHYAHDRIDIIIDRIVNSKSIKKKIKIEREQERIE